MLPTVYRTVKAALPREFKRWLREEHIAILDEMDYLFNRRSIHVYPPIEGMMSGDERQYLHGLARSLNPDSICVEIGCYAGLSAYLLGMAAIGSGFHVFSIDPFDYDPDRQRRESDGSEYLKVGECKPSLAEVEETMRRFGLQNTVKLIQGFSHEVVEDWHTISESVELEN